MKITQAVTMASALLLAAGCAHEQQRAQYDESMSPAYSGRTGESGNGGNNNMSPPSSSASEQVSGNVVAGKSGSASDNTIVAEVRESLQRNAEIAPIVPNIQISANNGAVVLSGSVQSEEQKRQIGALALQASGVVAVNNQLQIIANPGSRESGMENQPDNPLLNSTSSSSNSVPRIYKDAGDNPDNSNGNALNPTSLPNGADKIYQEPPQKQNGQGTNSNQTP